MKRHGRVLAVAYAGLTVTAYAAAAGPLVITHGGTYTGEWRSDDANVPAVKIMTKEPVVIENSKIAGRGRLIDADNGAADVIVRGVSGTSLYPGLAGRAAGRFFAGEEVARVVIEQCQLDGTGGIYIDRTDPATQNAQIRVRYNDVHNIDGRRADGQGGYLDFNVRKRLSDGHVEEGMDYVQFVQLNTVVGLADGEIAFNRVVNEPGRSRVEDNISVYETSGRPDSPLRVHDNLIVGAYSVNPSARDQTKDGWRYDWAYSGGGIMLGDGPGKTLATASGYLDCRDNVVVSTGNYGIGVAGGHDIRVDDNRVVGSARLTNGREVRTQNVGIYVWDIAKGRLRTPPTCFGIRGTGNVVGWFDAIDGRRNDWWVPNATIWHGNVALPSPLTATLEATESARWATRVKAAGVMVGSSTSTTSPVAR